MEGRAHWAEFQPGEVHGVEGVDVEDVEALLADDGVNNERVATRSGDVGRMVSLIKSDRGVQPAKERGDG